MLLGINLYCAAVSGARFKVMPKFGHKAERSDKHFYMGRFYARIFGEVFEDTRDPPFKMRIIPIHKQQRTGQYSNFHTENYLDSSEILKNLEDSEHVLYRGMKGTFNLHNLLFSEITKPSLHQLAGLNASIVYNKAYDNPSVAFTNGRLDGDHPGIAIRYGFDFPISGILKQIRNNKFNSNMEQHLSLGKSAREFEGGIEYGTVYNTRPFIIKKQGDAGDNNVSLCPTGKDFYERVNESWLDENSGSAYHKEGELWKHMLYDISMFGESVNPIHEWIYGSQSETGGVKNVAVSLDSQQVADHVAKAMRSSYFTGMGGSIYSIGNPLLRPFKVIKVKDERAGAHQRLEKAAIKGFRKAAELIQNMQIEDPRTPLIIKGMEKYFYVWKVRHYMGVNSGYISKVYFIEERDRSWQQYTESVDDIIRNAIQQFSQDVRVK